MFFARQLPDGNRVLIRKDAVRFVEELRGDTIRLHVDGMGEVVTDTYDFDGFARVVMDLDLEENEVTEWIRPRKI